MFLTKGSEYGIKAAIFIASKSAEGHRVNVNEIAAAINSPIAYTAKIMQKLVKGNIIESTRGAQGGFEMIPEKIKGINLFQIIKSIDGNEIEKKCVLGLDRCSSANPCPFHHKYISIRENTITSLKNTNIDELATRLDNKFSVLIN
ncbi:MAG TPA: Rrf2 family transcriptional regulator [Chitinophagales bacterium]|nr:Rrf2 family transcriptional regulator [Chitinophagales bacterium]